MRCFLVLVCVVGLSVGCDVEGRKKKGEPPAAVQNSKPLGEPVAQLDADQLVREYVDNAVAADSKYKGKTVEVKGHLFKLWTGADGRYQFDLGKPIPDPADWDRFGQNLPPSILGNIDTRYASDFAKAKQDHVISVIGRCRGMQPDRLARWQLTVILDQCRLP